MNPEPGPMNGDIERQAADLRAELDRCRQTLESLHRSEERYRTTFEIAGDTLYTLSVDGTLTSLSPAFEAITGWRCSDWVGKPIADIVHPEDLPTLLSHLQSSGRGLRGPAFELRILSKSGEYLDGEFVTAPMFEDGDLVGVFGIARNFADRKRVERELLQSVSALETVFQALPDLYFRMDSEGKILDYKAGRVSDLYAPPQQFLGRAMQEVLPRDVGAQFEEAVMEMRATRCPVAMEYSLPMPGGVQHYEARLMPLLESEVVAIVRNTTERKRLEGQLLRAQRLEAAGRIAGQVAHDFNNLLGPLVAYPELIKMQLSEAHPARQYCDAMLEAAERMADINEDMMALGRRGHFDQETVDLNVLAKQAVDQMSTSPRNLTVEMDLASGLPPVNGSPAQLMRVISNLLSNARDAMHDLGLLTVRTESVYVDRPVGSYNRIEAGEYVKLSVSDTGSGIAPEIRDKIFDAFFTTKSRANRRGGGLGLSIVQAIVDDHRGYVDLESEVGIGTTFSVYLPAVGPEGPEALSERLRGGRESILVVDDDGLQREVTRALLVKLGYQVEVVSSGEEALGHLRQHPVDLLIVDMIMPGGMDGVETFRRVLELRPQQKAIIVSGFSESERVREAQLLGAGGYLRKPVTLERLAKAVREELDR